MFRIGDFAKFTRISVKMLRHYDALGLLHPAFVDPQSGYRYYRADQIPRLNRIIALKDVGFSLEQIGVVLKEDPTPDQLRAMLRLRALEALDRIRAERERLAQIEARMQLLDRTGETRALDVIVRPLPPLLVATIRQMVSADSDQISQLFEEAERYVARQRARAAESPLLLSHDQPEWAAEIEIEVAVPLTHPIAAGERVAVRTISAVPQAACVVYTGSYHRQPEALEALLAWIGAHDAIPEGPLREVYLRFGAATSLSLPESFLASTPEEFVTELQIPIEYRRT